MSQLPEYLCYATPHWNSHSYISRDGYVLQVAATGPHISFLEQSGVLCFAGAFEEIKNPTSSSGVHCRSMADLDRREKELVAGLRKDIVFVFLLPPLLTHSGRSEVDIYVDLFRRVAAQFEVQWSCDFRPSPHTETLIPEFVDYITSHGAGYIKLKPKRTSEECKPISKAGNDVYGLVVQDRLFFLPSVSPQDAEHAVRIVESALQAVIAYRKRTSKEMPAWVSSFRFSNEQSCCETANALRNQLEEIDAKIESYASYKGALCLRSDPLVSAVADVLRYFFNIHITVDEKFIEDASLVDPKGNVLAVFEIKGINGSFGRTNINQVDTHRERLSLPPSTPGILIMNTMMASPDLHGKEEEPHPDIIKHAVTTNVLMIRTLDLLRYADLVERGTLTKESFRKILLSEIGWLKVAGDTPSVIKA